MFATLSHRIVFAVFICISSVFASAQAPGAPASVKAMPAGNAEVALTWDPSGPATSFNIYWDTKSGVTPATGKRVSGSITLQAKTVTGLGPAGTPFFFVVTAVSGGVESPPSAEVTSLSGTAAPSANPVTPGSGSSALPAAATTATTNVGSSSTENVQHPAITYAPLIIDPKSPLNALAGTVSYATTTDVETLIAGACQQKDLLADPSTYALINVLRADGPNGQQVIKSTNWYLFKKTKHWALSDFDGATRFYGAKKIVLVSIILNEISAATPTIAYTLTVDKTQASNVAAVYQLLGLIFPQAATPDTDAKPANYQGCAVVPIAYKTSSIKVDTTYTAGGGSPFTSSQSFVNEAKQYWDVSFALPVTKASALQYSSTANTVTATTINKQSLFAVADLYVPAANLSATGYNLIPHPFVGVAMDSQPLHSFLFGAAVGLHLAEVYAGALLLKQQQIGIATGSSASTAQVAAATTYGYKASFSVGIKISVTAAIAALGKVK